MPPGQINRQRARRTAPARPDAVAGAEVEVFARVRRIPGIDKIHAAIGWRPVIELDQTLDEVIAETRAQLAQA